MSFQYEILVSIFVNSVFFGEYVHLQVKIRKYEISSGKMYSKPFCLYLSTIFIFCTILLLIRIRKFIFLPICYDCKFCNLGYYLLCCMIISITTFYFYFHSGLLQTTFCMYIHTAKNRLFFVNFSD